MTNPKEDPLSQILGPDNPGRLRAMGRGMNMTKLACYQVKSKYMVQMQENQVELQHRVHELETLIQKMNSQQKDEQGETSAPRSVNKSLPSKCLLVDWSGTEDSVAEARLISQDPDEFVNDIPLGPNSVKVLIEAATKPEAFLWRPTPNMLSMEAAVGQFIAWPADSVVAAYEEDDEQENVPKSPFASSMNRCKLMDWATNDEPVAEGRWQSRDPKALVNGLPLGPNAIKVYVDRVLSPHAFLWRPTAEITNMEAALMSFVAWPANKIEFETGKEANVQKGPIQQSPASTKSPTYLRSSLQQSPTTPKSSKNKSTAGEDSPLDKSPETPKAPGKKSKAGPIPSQQSEPTPKPAPANPKPGSKSPAKKSKALPQSPLRKSTRNAVKENQKCKLMDITGKKRVVAEGRWASNNPDQVVHFVPLGPNAVRVWVDVVKIKTAALWRSSSEIESMEDAIGTSIAWPEDKVVLC